MNSEHKKQRRDLINDTILNMPTPRACSTAQKPLDLKKVPFSDKPNTSDDTLESLGLLDVSNLSGLCETFSKFSLSCNEAPENLQPDFTNEKFQQRRSLDTNYYGLPSRYLRASDSLKACDSPTFSVGSDSTVNESDLLRPHSTTKQVCNVEGNITSFSPGDISIPRSSCASNDSPRKSTSIICMSKGFAQPSQQMENSDTSLNELCELSLHCNEALEFIEESPKPSIAESLSVTAIEKIIASHDNTATLMQCLFGEPAKSKTNEKGKNRDDPVSCLLGSCTVEPTTVVLTPPTKIEDNIVPISHKSRIRNILCCFNSTEDE